ncbi:MAG TPA: Ig-like domain-containing protein, partial [Flavitalea sp.]|nr:Ig-like domain-containing protein [Flavitalea sp.]
MNLNKNLHWFIYIIFLLSCARQSSPTGGPKDTIPPVLVRAIPANEAINFKEKAIELVFSEAVILNAPKEQLIVTPTIGKEYKIVNRKNSIILTFEDPLLDSTTYTFNFRESIQDITEKNPVRNLQLAYSTGDYIDSLSIEGSVYDMLKGKEIKDASVALHVENDTFNILEHPAVYFTKTDEK